MSLFGKLFGKKRDDPPQTSPPQPARAPQMSPSVGVSVYPPGARIAGRYEVAGRPLMGGMGIVYPCFDHEEQRPVALKTFRPEFLPDRAARDRFLREGTTWVKLGAHPHIVRCYRVVHIGLEVYLVLDLVAGTEGRADASLRAWLTPGMPLPVDQALLFAVQITRGMQHAAEAIPGFVHRDLKPENVLVGADRLGETGANRLRVTDFGLAAVVEGISEQGAEVGGQGAEESRNLGRTQLTRGIVGTPLYMAPEQWRGEPVTMATDVYALGCVLYEMLTGQHAVAGNSLVALERAHCTGQIQPLPDSLPTSARKVTASCLAPEPEGRYGSWVAVEMALAAAYRQVAGRAAPAGDPVGTLGGADRVAIGWSYRDIGDSYRDIGKAEVALGYFERARAAGEAEGERRLEGAGLNSLGLTYHCLGDPRRAISYFERALGLSREIGDRYSEGLSLMNLGSAYNDIGDAQRAVGCHEQALAIAREIGNRRGEGQALGNLGTAYMGLGDTRQAIDCHEQALVIKREIGDQRGEENSLGNLGRAYADLGDTRRAIGCFEHALAIARKIGDRRGEGLGLMNLGITYMDLGDTRRGDDHCQQARAVFEEIGDMMNIARISYNLAAFLAQQGHFAEALPHAQRAAQVFSQIGHAQLAQQAEQLVTQLQVEGLEILARFGLLIETVVAGAEGNRQARAAVELGFGQLEQSGWHIVEPIRCIWAGERDEANLTAGIGSSSALIVREILKRLKD